MLRGGTRELVKDCCVRGADLSIGFPELAISCGLTASLIPTPICEYLSGIRCVMYVDASSAIAHAALCLVFCLVVRDPVRLSIS